ncbi:MAG: signal peptidase I [Elusimicrobia bacterium]|nr:signal peptidase I [Elusimicrobiota bacterium]
MSPRTLKTDLLSPEGKRLAREWGDSLIVAFLLAMVIRTFLFQPFKIPSGSMRMTLVEGDRLFVNKLQYGPLVPFTHYRIPGFTRPQRGDVIVFRYPVTRDKDFIKRLIAFGGESVEIKDGTIYINGDPVEDPRIKGRTYYNAGPYGALGRKVTVPEGHFFVLGDNSASSHDSRYWGFVPEYLLIGKAESLFWPARRIGWIK